MVHATPGQHAEERQAGPGVLRAARLAALVGLVGLAAGLLCGVLEGWTAFFRAYVLNFSYVMSLALGALFFVILQHLTRAGWSVVVRRLGEFVIEAIPRLALLALPLLIPVLAGMSEVYPWSAPGAVGDHELQELLARKRPYLNPAFFVVRLALYFAIWTLLARFYVSRSLAQDDSGDIALTQALERRSGIAMVAFALTTTFFAFDVLKSLTPMFFSTIFGVYYFAGAVVGFFGLLGLMMTLLQRSGKLTRSITIEHYHDIGKLVFGFIVFWAYIAYSQYMLIWYANLPEETFWYAMRQASGWWIGVALVLLFGHFVLPFLALMSRGPKRRPAVVTLGAAWALLMHWVDLYYVVGPPGHTLPPEGHAGAALHVADLALLVGLGGLFAAAVLRNMAGRALLPQRDPRLGESVAFENI